MSKHTFVDFKAVKAAITMEQVLERYGLLDRFKRSRDSLSGPCPIHQGENPTQFRVSLSKSIWNCFSKCKCGGNVLDFISMMENVSIYGAALKAIEWFDLNPDDMSADSGEERQGDTARNGADSSPKPAAKKAVVATEKSTPNPPLKFRLDNLECDHPYLAERGLAPETIADFGIGYCAKGMMAQRIAIPIRNVEGNIVAYAGRIPGEPTEDEPKYKLPPGFKKSQELFNLDRAINEPLEKPFVIVEGFFDCMALHQHGYRKVVAIMGDTMSVAQEELIRQYITGRSHVIIMLDENDAGVAGREDIACRLSKHCFVKVHVFDTPDAEPEHLTAEEVKSILD
jgi:DNA primase